MFDTVVKSVNGLLWGEGQILIYILLFAGIWFSVRLKAIQIVKFKHMFSLLKGSSKCKKDDISSFQALFYVSNCVVLFLISSMCN